MPQWTSVDRAAAAERGPIGMPKTGHAIPATRSNISLNKPMGDQEIAAMVVDAAVKTALEE